MNLRKRWDVPRGRETFLVERLAWRIIVASPVRSPVLAAFIDGLRTDSVEHMPFVSSMSKPVGIRTELGYSITCHPSMYTGVWPDQHLSWFIWKKDPETSPFRWLRDSGLDRLPESPYLKYGFYRIARAAYGNTAFFNIPFPAFVPLKHWHCFDVTEKRYWDEDGFNPHFPTIFELFRRHGVSTRTVGMDAQASRSAETLARLDPEFADFTYLFFGDIDAVSHARRQDSPASRARLAAVDRAIERWHRAAVARGGEPTFLLWSDHGHIPIEEHVDIDAIFRARRVDLSDTVHFVDSNYARFWFKDEAERARIERVLPDLGKGFVITPEVAEKYHVRMPDNRYGDLVYYLEAPAVFDKGSFDVFGKAHRPTDVSMHGYSPENIGIDGALVTNRPVRLARQPILQDIPPTLLSHFGLDVPSYMVGRSLW